MKITLKKPIEFEGQKHNEINLDFDSLTGADILTAEQMYTRSNLSNAGNMAKEFSKEYQIHVAARAANLPVELFLKLGALDFSVITVAVQNFFLDVSVG